MTQQPLSGEFNPTVPTRVIFGQGKVSTLGTEVDQLGGKRALVLSGRTVAEKTDTVRKVNEALGVRTVGVYSGLTQRAPLATAVEAANLAVSQGADTLVGVGGSTISDAARMIGVLMADGITTSERLRTLAQEQGGMLSPDLEGKQLPLQVSIPTTLSAGEFNMGGGNVLDDQAGHKIRVRHSGLFADLIVLDPEMTVGTPDWLWLSTGVKALDHCIERLYCQGNQPAIDAPVLVAAQRLFEYLPHSGEAHNDLNARLECLLAAWLSMMGAPNFATGLSHALGHVIGVRYSVGHGYTSCVTQPYVMDTTGRYPPINRRCWRGPRELTPGVWTTRQRRRPRPGPWTPWFWGWECLTASGNWKYLKRTFPSSPLKPWETVERETTPSP